MRIHNKLESLVYAAIDLNKEWQNDPRVFKSKESLGRFHYAKEYQTVKIDVGRQIGKSTLIARSVGSKDVGFSYNERAASYLLKQISSYNSFGIPVFSPAYLPECNTLFDTVWVDESKVMSENDILLMYETFAGKCNRFVFLG